MCLIKEEDGNLSFHVTGPGVIAFRLISLIFLLCFNIVLYWLEFPVLEQRTLNLSVPLVKKMSEENVPGIVP